MRTLTTEERIVVQLVAAVGTAIRDLKKVPAGHLYASVMGSMTLDQFEQIIRQLVAAGLVVREESHLLRWTGPAR